MTNNKIAIITGVTRESGLGFETAKQLKELGLTVIITGRNSEQVSQLAEQAGVLSRQLDITNNEQIAEFVQEITVTYGKIDVLINNAGAYFDQGGQALTADMEFIQAAFNTNLLGAWRMIQALMNLLLKSAHGRIVNVSSGAGSFSDPIFGLEYHQGNVPVYSLTKLALNGLTVKLGKELRDTSIKINSVCPGFVATYPGTEQWGARPVSEGAKGIVWAATLPDDGPTGKFFRDGKPINW